MIMAMDDGDRQPRKPAPNHPWNHPERRAAAADLERSQTNARTSKVTMVVTRAEFLALRARAGGKTMSEFLRSHFPPELLKHPHDGR